MSDLASPPHLLNLRRRFALTSLGVITVIALGLGWLLSHMLTQRMLDEGYLLAPGARQLLQERQAGGESEQQHAPVELFEGELAHVVDAGTPQQLHRPDAGYLGKGVDVRGHLLGDGDQRHVGEHHVCRHGLLPGGLQAPRAQGVQQLLVEVGRTGLAAAQRALLRGDESLAAHAAPRRSLAGALPPCLAGTALDHAAGERVAHVGRARERLGEEGADGADLTAAGLTRTRPRQVQAVGGTGDRLHQDPPHAAGARCRHRPA